MRWLWRLHFSFFSVFVPWRQLTYKTKFQKELEKWRQNGPLVRRGEGMGKKRGTASDYWEDKDPAVLGLTAPSTSGVPHPSLQAHHPIPSTQGNFLLLTTHPSFIYPSIHLSFPKQMEIITHNNTTTNSWLSLFSPTSHPNLSSSAWRVFWSDLSSQSQWWKEICLNHAKNVTGRFWCGLAILSASEFRTLQANSRVACMNASIRCRTQSWFCITLD